MKTKENKLKAGDFVEFKESPFMYLTFDLSKKYEIDKILNGRIADFTFIYDNQSGYHANYAWLK